LALLSYQAATFEKALPMLPDRENIYLVHEMPKNALYDIEKANI
jgi:hypothetical protein